VTLTEILSTRRARFRWGVLLPAAIALYFAALAYEDVGVGSALPYLAVASLSLLHLWRPAYVFWALPFVGFAAYTAVMLVAPAIGFGGTPLAEQLVFLALGLVPTFLLWLARPRAAA
jgi:hypothetical protein